LFENLILNLGLFYISNLPGQTLGGNENQVYILCMIGMNEYEQKYEEWKTWKHQLSSYNAYIEFRYLLVFTFIPFILSLKPFFFHYPPINLFIYFDELWTYLINTYHEIDYVSIVCIIEDEIKLNYFRMNCKLFSEAIRGILLK
jgi:hypothetical protein